MKDTLEVTRLDEHSNLVYLRDFLDQQSSAALLEHCQNNLHWKQSQITLFGKRHPIPRLNAWYGDEPYSYSGTHFAKRDWTPDLSTVKHQVEQHANFEVNSVLANLYRGGSDSMGWHSDNEKSLGPMPQIASVSLGATRRFVLRKKADKKQKVTLELCNGSLLLMLGETQLAWEHSLPKTAKKIGLRINLTFRNSFPTVNK